MTSRPRSSASSKGLWLYGLHAVRAALANPARKLNRAVLTEHARAAIGPGLLDKVRHEIATADTVARFVPAGSVHQGIALSCEPLPRGDLDKAISRPMLGRRLVVILDQISDPQNVGAIMRSAAAFGVCAVVVQDRHAPPESGTLAKAASGGLDVIPYIQVVNIARALDSLGESGFYRVALAGDGDQTLSEAVPPGDAAVVLGSEGSGIRRLVRETCDTAAYIPVSAQSGSLNVSNAAAIALYELRRT
jgi:23S rRNA (guanosine2251-2'-O)-methyltransferase